ncbi:thermonuclease family protein [Microvirga puerhi]|uniref:Thermonuclease family protein n=1 Tax=Microvirga puerhi TaxID=2876078 RepID=A0ABS7VK50_9HYPH|nr:thermonuclease family protein [Microvirga puerhi]MBZ6075869.1 thermonuclease family protein [Microvirga puerhi]
MKAPFLTGFALALLGCPVYLTSSEAVTTKPPTSPEISDCVATATPDRIKAVMPDGDLVLAAGGRTRLSDIRLPEPPAAREQALTKLRSLVDQPIMVQSLSRPDRWGRRIVRIRAMDQGEAADLAETLVDAGLALVDPGTASTLCQPELLAIEETARERSLGLWTDGLYKPIDASHPGNLDDRFGTFALIEGRVRSIGERKQRVYLNFGGHWAEDFTIIIPKKTWKLMTERGLTAASLKGQRIRSRGILEPWQGAALTVVVPEMIEHLDGTRLSR